MVFEKMTSVSRGKYLKHFLKAHGEQNLIKRIENQV